MWSSVTVATYLESLEFFMMSYSMEMLIYFPPSRLGIWSMIMVLLCLHLQANLHDLNVIVPLWAALKRKMTIREPKSADYLNAAIKNNCFPLYLFQCQRWITSMAWVIYAVILERRGPSKSCVQRVNIDSTGQILLQNTSLTDIQNFKNIKMEVFIGRRPWSSNWQG